MNSGLERIPNQNLSHTEIEFEDNEAKNKNQLIKSLINRLEFKSTQELDAVGEAIVEGLRDVTTDVSILTRAWVEYGQIVEKIVTEAEGSAEYVNSYAKAQIATMIHKAAIFFEAGNTIRYIEELDQAEVYAYNLEFDDISDALLAEIDEEIETLDMSAEVLIIKLKGKVSEQHREILRDFALGCDDFEVILGHAHDMILEEGNDPIETLAHVGVIER